MSKTRGIILFVEQYLAKAINGIREEYPDVEIILIRDQKKKSRDTSDFSAVDEVLYVDFTNDTKLASTLLPYQRDLVAVTARGEDGVNKLKHVIPHVPYLRTPTQRSLEWASDKYEMRKRMKVHAPQGTPRFTKVKDASKQERNRVIEKVGFPMIVKPANLQESMLVSICYHETELEKITKNIFRKLRKNYEKYNRVQTPTIIAEEFIDGSLYSIDSYVNSRGDTYHCPLVQVKTGKDIGHDDFYNYLQITPAKLKKTTIERAQAMADSAIHALGLRNTTTHTELLKVDDEWKIVEVGARIGGFRDLLYRLSCDIDHSLNDVRIRIPKKPVIPKKCKGFACAMKWFAEKEGQIIEMKGIKKIEELGSFHSIIMNKKVGDRAIFARNGGRSVFNLIMYNDDRSKLLADIRRVEQMVKIKVAARRAKPSGGKTGNTVKKK